ncbi:MULTISPECIES: nuclear transport factor 2 family protein [unclassified Chelatococcus]|nr:MULTISPECIES: nuclear transport factor 2 family protein [unclassified Chelatococcus]
MQANLDLVFGERDPTRRIAAIQRIYAENAELHEPERSARGHEAISQAVADVLEHLPPGFVFTALRPAVGHNGVGRLQWGVGPAGGPFAATGTDVAHVEGGLLRTLHVCFPRSTGTLNGDGVLSGEPSWRRPRRGLCRFKGAAAHDRIWLSCGTGDGCLLSEFPSQPDASVH